MTTAPTDHATGRPARILLAAERLIMKNGFRGVSMAQVADSAHVGKGTPYLYWRTKEALFLELLARSVLATLDDLAALLEEQPELATPSRLCTWLIRAAVDQPLLRALQSSDEDVLGALVSDPRGREMMRRHGGGALLRELLPRWRHHGLVDPAGSLEDQAFVLEIVSIGYFEAIHRDVVPMSGGSADQAVIDALDVLLQGRQVSPQVLRTIADEALAIVRAHGRGLGRAVTQGLTDAG